MVEYAAIDNLSTYLAKYPRCCSVRSSSTYIDSPILNAFFLRRFYEVIIQYPVASPAENRGKPFYESVLILDCCGQYVPDKYGMPSDSIREGPAA